VTVKVGDTVAVGGNGDWLHVCYYLFISPFAVNGEDGQYSVQLFGSAGEEREKLGCYNLYRERLAGRGPRKNAFASSDSGVGHAESEPALA
jgi:adenosine deaminase